MHIFVVKWLYFNIREILLFIPFFLFISFFLQLQLMRASIKISRIKRIFVTHLHGDHAFGLAGVLCMIGQALHNQNVSSFALLCFVLLYFFVQSQLQDVQDVLVNILLLLCDFQLFLFKTRLTC